MVFIIQLTPGKLREVHGPSLRPGRLQERPCAQVGPRESPCPRESPEPRESPGSRVLEWRERRVTLGMGMHW